MRKKIYCWMLGKDNFLKDGIKTLAHKDHKHFMATNDDLESGLREMITGLERYCKGYAEDGGDGGMKVGEDYYARPNVATIANALQNLLSGPGVFDGGVLSTVINKICEVNGVDINEVEN